MAERSKLTPLPSVAGMIRVVAGSMLALSPLACGKDDGDGVSGTSSSGDEAPNATADDATLTGDEAPNSTIGDSSSGGTEGETGSTGGSGDTGSTGDTGTESGSEGGSSSSTGV